MILYKKRHYFNEYTILMRYSFQKKINQIEDIKQKEKDEKHDFIFNLISFF